MEVHVTNPDLERKLSDLAQRSGRGADELVQDALAGYFEELATLRSTLDARYDDLKSGRVQPIDGEDAFARLKAKSDGRPNGPA
jgi:predicted transcriptional regulator